MKGHLSCRDTFSGILRCPLKTSFTVSVILVSRQDRWPPIIVCLEDMFDCIIGYAWEQLLVN